MTEDAERVTLRGSNINAKDMASHRKFDGLKGGAFGGDAKNHLSKGKVSMTIIGDTNEARVCKQKCTYVCVSLKMNRRKKLKRIRIEDRKKERKKERERERERERVCVCMCLVA